MNKRLEQIRELMSPFENRIKSIETEEILEATRYQILGVAECAIRGALIGGIVGALASGFDIAYFIGGVGIGATLDMSQDAIRKLNWVTMRGNNLEEYQNNIRVWKRILKIRYGKYAD